MEIMNSPLAADINDILNAKDDNSDAYWRAEIVANGKTLEVLKVISHDNLQDFEENYCDVFVVQCLIGQGTYTYKIFPYLDNLELVLYREPLTEKGSFRDPNQKVYSQRYRATIINPRAPVITSRMADEEALNLQDLEVLSVQLQDFFIEQLRTVMHGTIYRKMTLADIVKYVLTLGAKTIKIDDKYRPLGVEMVDAVNTTVREQTPIPQGTIKLVDVPQYVHSCCGGIYPSGFSYYMSRRMWYVFPSYDTTRFKKSQKTLTIIRIPSNRMPNVERTYLQNGNNLKVLVTGDISTADNSESMILNEGNGIRFADASKMIDGFVTTKNNATLASRGDLVNEVKAIDRPSGIDYAAMSPQRITTNKMVELSRIARRNGTMVILEWENSNPDLLIPGVPVKILYLSDDKVCELFGVLLKAHSFTGLRGTGITASRHSTSTALAVFVTKKYPSS